MQFQLRRWRCALRLEVGCPDTPRFLAAWLAICAFLIVPLLFADTLHVFPALPSAILQTARLSNPGLPRDVGCLGGTSAMHTRPNGNEARWRGMGMQEGGKQEERANVELKRMRSMFVCICFAAWCFWSIASNDDLPAVEAGQGGRAATPFKSGWF